MHYFFDKTNLQPADDRLESNIEGEALDGLDVEALEPVRLEVGRDEDRQVVQAVLQIMDRVAGQVVHGAVVPNVGVHPEEAVGAHAVLEEADRLILFPV